MIIATRVYEILQQVKGILKQSHAVVPRRIDFEISHHYGIQRFHEFGATIITFLNREYCKKLIVMVPGQQHPEQHHRLKEETFQVLHGEIELTLDGETRTCSTGEIVTVPRNPARVHQPNGSGNRGNFLKTLPRRFVLHRSRDRDQQGSQNSADLLDGLEEQSWNCSKPYPTPNCGIAPAPACGEAAAAAAVRAPH